MSRRILVLRFDAPLMSFGGVVVDHRGVTREYPATSMLTGLFANALGWDHGSFDRLEALQSRLRFAVRQDRPGKRLRDFQTVDLGQDFLRAGWTTRGMREGRGGGSAKTGTHIRLRDYLADAVYTVAVELRPHEEDPTVDDIGRVLRRPSRPLFIGRKTCLPSTDIYLNVVSAPSLVDALCNVPRHPLADGADDFAAWWPDGEPAAVEGHPIALTDERDWRNQVHVGRRLIRQGRLSYAAADDGQTDG